MAFTLRFDYRPMGVRAWYGEEKKRMNTEERALPLTTGKITSLGDGLYWLPVLFDGEVIAQYIIGGGA